MDEKTYAIITYTKSHYLISDEQEEKLRFLKLDEEIRIDGNLIKASNIAEVMTIAKYYETYPDKRPTYVDRYKNTPGVGYGEIVKRIKNKDALKSLLVGFCRSGHGDPELKKKIRDRYIAACRLQPN